MARLPLFLFTLAFSRMSRAVGWVLFLAILLGLYGLGWIINQL